MNFLAVLAALGLEQWRAFHWRGALERAVRPLRARARAQAQRRYRRSRARSRRLAALAPPVLIAVGAYWIAGRAAPAAGPRLERRGAVPADGVSPLQPRVLGDRRGARGAATSAGAPRAGAVARRRRPAELSSSDVARLAIERGLVDSYRQVFATLFWFTVLPGPAGAVLYRAAALLADEWQGDARGTDDHADRPGARAVRAAGARACCGCSTGSRCGSLRCRSPSSATSRTPSSAGARRRGRGRRRPAGEHAGILLASGAGALGVLLGGTLPVLARRARVPARAGPRRRGRTPICCPRRSRWAGAR